MGRGLWFVDAQLRGARMSRETDPMMIHEYRKVVAQSIAAEIYEKAADSLRWENYPEIGEYDWDAIVDMVDDKGPAFPTGYEYAKAWHGLTGLEA